jgi:vitamin B12 transporter
VTSSFGVNYSNSQTYNIDRVLGNCYYQGDRVEYDWRSVIEVALGYTVVTGAEHQNEQFDGRDISVEEWNNGAFAELQSEVFRDFFLTANLRFDDK